MGPDRASCLRFSLSRRCGGGAIAQQRATHSCAVPGFLSHEALTWVIALHAGHSASGSHRSISRGKQSVLSTIQNLQGGWSVLPFAHEEIETQRGEVTCLSAHGEEVMELGLKPRPEDKFWALPIRLPVLLPVTCKVTWLNSSAPCRPRRSSLTRSWRTWSVSKSSK